MVLPRPRTLAAQNQIKIKGSGRGRPLYTGMAGAARVELVSLLILLFVRAPYAALQLFSCARMHFRGAINARPPGSRRTLTLSIRDAGQRSTFLLSIFLEVCTRHRLGSHTRPRSRRFFPVDAFAVFERAGVSVALGKCG